MDIQKFLDRKRMSQTELADILDADTTAVNNWVRGKNTPKYTMLVRLLKMGARIDELFSEDVCRSVLETHSDDFRESVQLSADDCAEIVRKGLEAMKAQGREPPVQLKR